MKLLRDGDEGDLVLVEDLHDPGKIEQRATEAVQLVGQYGVDLTGGNIRQKPLEGGPFQVGAAVAAVIVVLRQRQPALLLLAGDIGLGGFPLGIQGVEFLLQAFLGRFAGVDGTAHRFGGGNAVANRLHEATPWGRRRKKR